MSAIRVLIVDDQALIRKGIQSLLGRKADIEVVGQASDGADAVAQVAVLDPDVVLMDIMMPGTDGVEATRRLQNQGARSAVIILTTFHDDENVIRAIAAGARGYLLKDVDHKELAEAIRTVAAGHALIAPQIVAQLLPRLGQLDAPVPQPPTTFAWLDTLTDREHDILKMLAGGCTNQEISRRLVISVGTVKNHISSILAKLNVRDRTQAALLAQQAGLMID